MIPLEASGISAVAIRTPTGTLDAMVMRNGLFLARGIRPLVGSSERVRGGQAQDRVTSSVPDHVRFRIHYRTIRRGGSTVDVFRENRTANGATIRALDLRRILGG